jgi:hypothetical protein
VRSAPLRKRGNEDIVMRVYVEDVTDTIGRNFEQPEEGAGFDDTPSSHMSRTMMMPTRFL